MYFKKRIKIKLGMAYKDAPAIPLHHIKKVKLIKNKNTL